MVMTGSVKAEATTRVVLGTATPGGGFPLYGAAVAAALAASDPGLALETRNTKGSTENLPLLEARGWRGEGEVAPAAPVS